MALTEQQNQLIKNTVPALREHGTQITEHFYDLLFQDPAIKAMFEDTSQPTKLATAILAYAENIDKLDVLKPAVDRMVAKHVAAGVKPEHYPIVKTALFQAITDILGPLDAETAEAWSLAYDQLADLLKTLEQVASRPIADEIEGDMA